MIEKLSKEIKQRIAKRKQLAREVVEALMPTNRQEVDRRLEQLRNRYGEAEVSRELAVYQQQANMLRDQANEDTVLYGGYVNHYSRFGGERPFLSLEDFLEANNEAAPLIIRHELGHILTEDEQARLDYLSDLLLKEAIFWDGIVPDNPPPTMPAVELPPLQITVPDVAAGLPMSSYPLCPNDGFPLLGAGGKLICSLETLDGCLGGKKVVDVIKRGRLVYYVFEDGHQLPLLCGCCGAGLTIDDLPGVRQEIAGRHLASIGIETRTIEEEGREYDQFILEFSKPGLFTQPVFMEVAFEAAAALRHPSASGSTKTGLASSSKRSKSTKKKRPKQRRRKKK